jgi:hypothetical protein
MYNVLYGAYKLASPFFLENDGSMEVEKSTREGHHHSPFVCKNRNIEVKNQGFAYCICINLMLYLYCPFRIGGMVSGCRSPFLWCIQIETPQPMCG